MSLGTYKVQGVDFVYTIQGWLKAINGDVLNPETDMGKDDYMHNLHLKDAMSHRLDYFKEDYKPINAAAQNTLKDLAIEKQLYNGNIASMTNDLLPFDALNRQYLYDQLNRIVQARSKEHTSELQSRGHLVCRLLL